ncbi:hypothetical protein CIP106467_0613 [Citrobacter europaeus]|nr:hypothetical protein CIP106467_0613 [Citrobacter europaeus]
MGKKGRVKQVAGTIPECFSQCLYLLLRPNQFIRYALYQ